MQKRACADDKMVQINSGLKLTHDTREQTIV